MRRFAATVFVIAALAFALPTYAVTPPAFTLSDADGNQITIDSTGAIVFSGNSSCTAGVTCKTITSSVSPGVITWGGNIGAFTLQVIVGATKPVTGTPPTLDIGLQSLSTGSNGGLLTAKWTDAGFSGSGIAGSTLSVGGSINGSVNLQFSAYLDNGNVPFGTGVLAGTLGPFSTSPFSGSINGLGPSSSPFSMTEVLTIAMGPNSRVGGDFEFKTLPPLGSIGDFVWQDNNGNGIQDPGEPGINGVTVRLKNAGGTVLDTKVTSTFGAQTGYYLFPNLAGGTYVVEVDPTTVPAGFSPTLTGVGSPSTDSNGSPATVILPEGANDLTIDFGYVPACTGLIGDFVWNDLNLNGIQDPGEPGISGVKVLLKHGSDPVREATTNAAGAYEFGGLCAGNYIVEVDASTVPPNFVATTSMASGSTPANDSNGSPTSAVLNSFNSIDRTVDFGYYSSCRASIGDFLWHDLNRNGIQDPGEPGLNGITVRLKNSSNVVIGTTTTAMNGGTNGYYQFTGLCAGSYTVEYDAATVPSGFVPTTANAPGSTPATDSNPNPSPVNLSANHSSDQTIDFGFIVPCTGVIGDFVWEDLNKNGVQETGEPGISGITVNLRNAADHSLLATTTTNASGLYQFTGRCQGSYKVEVVPPSGYTASPTGAGTPSTDSNPNPSTVNLPADNAADLTIDFGFFKTPTGGFVTFTQGGWGSKPAGNNPGKLLATHFSSVYPSGVTVGGNYTLHFTSAKAIENYLPSGGTPSVLKASATDPASKSTNAGVFSSQVLALQLSADFSAAGKLPVGLGSLKLVSGPLAGQTVNQVLALANAVLGGNTGLLPAGMTVSGLNDVVDGINNNFVDGKNGGLLQ